MRERDQIPDSVLVKRMVLNGIIARESKTLAITIQREGHKFLVQLRDGSGEMWLSLQDKGVTWE